MLRGGRGRRGRLNDVVMRSRLGGRLNDVARRPGRGSSGDAPLSPAAILRPCGAPRGVPLRRPLSPAAILRPCGGAGSGLGTWGVRMWVSLSRRPLSPAATCGRAEARVWYCGAYDIVFLFCGEVFGKVGAYNSYGNGCKDKSQYCQFSNPMPGFQSEKHYVRKIQHH
jgi:hypothetical protein